MADERQFGSTGRDLEAEAAATRALGETVAGLDAQLDKLSGVARKSRGAVVDNASALQRALEKTQALSNVVAELTGRLESETAALGANSAAWAERTAAIARAARASAAAPGIAGSATAAADAERVEQARAAAPRRRTTTAAPVVEEPVPLVTRDPQTGQWTALPFSQRPPSARGYRPTADEEIARTRQSTDPMDASLRALQGSEQQAAAAMQHAIDWLARRPIGEYENQEAVRAAQQGPFTLQPREQLLLTAGPQRLALPRGAAPPSAAPVDTAALARARQQAAVNAELAKSERSVALAYNEANAAVADASSSLSRHGALTTEFIQAFARGDVTLREFSSQMVSTIGKFGGWAVAGAAVYGAYDAIKKLGQGAKETQEGVATLSRFIPGVSGGPQRQQAEQTFRNISTQLNLPISDVTQAMGIMARVFHNVAEAGEAAKAVLLAVRLDQIPREQAEQYFTGIAQGIRNPQGGPMSGHDLVNVVDSLNELQNKYGARVTQTLPALARVAPIAQASGLSRWQLEGVIGTLTTSGLTGPQAATALLRSAGTFLYRPASQRIMEHYGIPAERGSYGQTLDALEQRITAPRPGQQVLGNKDLVTIANAMFGTQLGGRAGVPLLENIAKFGKQTDSAHYPTQSATEELSHILGGVGEQAKRLGIELQNIGSELESAGILEPLQLVLRAIGLFGSALEHAVSSVDHIIAPFERLPGAVKDVLFVAGALGAAKWAANTNAGFVAQRFVGRLPGLSDLPNEQAMQLKGTVARLRTEVVPLESRDAEQAALRQRRAAQAYELAYNDQVIARGRYGPGEKYDAAKADTAEAERDVQAATAEAKAAQDRIVATKRQIGVLTSKELDLQQRYNYGIEQLLIVQGESMAAQRTIIKQGVKADIERIKAGAAAGAASAGGVVGAGGVRTTFFAGTRGGDAYANREPVEPPTAAPRQTTFVGGTRAEDTVRSATAEQQAAIIGATALTEDPAALSNAAAAMRGSGATSAEQALTSTEKWQKRAVAMRDSPLVWTLAGGAISALPGAGPQALGNMISTAGIGALAAQLGGAGIARNLGKLPGGLGTALGGERATAALKSPLFGGGLALAAAGSTQGGAGGWISSAIGGGLAGAEFGPVGIAAGLAVGLGTHELGNLLGLQKGVPHTSKKVLAQSKSLSDVQAQLNAGGGGGVAWSEQFATLLDTAYKGNETTQDAQAASQAVQQGVSRASQMVKAVGIITTTGAKNLKLLESSIGSAGLSAAMQTDPYNTGQVIDSAWQGITAGIQNQFKYAIQIAPNRAASLRALHINTQRENKAYATAITDPEHQAQLDLTATRQALSVQSTGEAHTRAAAGLARARKNLADVPQLTAKFQSELEATGTQTGGDTQNEVLKYREHLTKYYKNLVSAYTGKGGGGGAVSLAAAVQELKQLKAVGAQLGQQKTEDLAGAADTYYQAASTWAQNALNNALAMAGGDQGKQLKAQIAATAARLKALNQSGLKQFNPEEYASEHGQRVLEQTQERIQQTQRGATVLQARSGLALAQIDQNISPIAYARQAAANAQKYLAYVRQHRKDFDVTDLKNAIAGVATANQNVAQTINQTQESLASAYEQLAEAQHPADAAATAQAQIGLGHRQMQLARTVAQRVAARQQLLAGRNAQAEANRSTADTNYQIQQAQQAGDPVAQALTGIAQARHDLATALGPDEVRAARLELTNANTALHQAEQDQISALANLQAAGVNDPVRRDVILLAGARKKLAQAIKERLGPQVIRQDRTDVASLQLQKFNDGITSQIDNIDYLQSTLQISSQDALARLQKLAKRKGLSPDQKRQIGSAIYGIETAQNNTNLFDLAPGGQGIKVPTIYDAATAAARERDRLHLTGERQFGHNEDGVIGRSRQHAHDVARLGGASVKTRHGALATSDLAVERAITALHRTLERGAPGATVGQIIVNVAAGEAGKVGDVLDRTLGTRVNARMRAAGVRGSN